ncbi:MAG: hypothetical protein NTV80_07425 [Verrucomicrobia bacterium]|nr:hypothetical protein [Verrucomicrobiota bacterium]
MARKAASKKPSAVKPSSGSPKKPSRRAKSPKSTAKAPKAPGPGKNDIRQSPVRFEWIDLDGRVLPGPVHV